MNFFYYEFKLKMQQKIFCAGWVGGGDEVGGWSKCFFQNILMKKKRNFFIYRGGGGGGGGRGGGGGAGTRVGDSVFYKEPKSKIWGGGRWSK